LVLSPWSASPWPLVSVSHLDTNSTAISSFVI
jgi:hypothetical protein